MPLRFYFDHNVHGAVVRALRRQQIDVLTCQEDGTRDWQDVDVLRRAIFYGRVLYSQDKDMLRHATRLQRNGVPFPGLIYVHQNKLPVGQQIHELVKIALRLDSVAMENRTIFLPHPH